MNIRIEVYDNIFIMLKLGKITNKHNNIFEIKKLEIKEPYKVELNIKENG